MANPQKENGYTAISNELLEALIKYQFPRKSSVPLRIVLYVIRKTYGYQKKIDTISISQFQDSINENNRSNLVYWLNYLVQGKIIVKNKISNIQVEYGLNKNYEEWLPLVQIMRLVQIRPWTSANNDTETSASIDTHKRKKEITKENSNVPLQEQKFSSKGAELIKAFEEVDPKNKTYYGNKTQRKACEFLISEYGEDTVLKVVSFLPIYNKQPFARKTYTPHQLKENWQSIKDHSQSLKNKKTDNIAFI